jgi:trehalose 6-phosphate phosphatase
MMPTGLLRCRDGEIADRIASASRLWLFLDYDGTLADFAPTPENPIAAPEVIGVLVALAAAPYTRVAVVSGRRLDHLQKLVPAAGILLAGTYGIELQHPDGRRIHRLPYQRVRPRLEILKPEWASLIAGRSGFYLEDKGWTLALHARFADDFEAEEVLLLARRLAAGAVEELGSASLRLLGGHKFLEIAPALVDKGETVDYLLENFSWDDALPVYVGDDDKDEKGFAVAKARGGIAVLVASRPRATHADCHMASPRAARRWLAQLAAQRAGL